MLIKQVELLNQNIKIEVDSELGMKILVSGVNISRSNTVVIKKSKLLSEFIEPLKNNGLAVDSIIDRSFNQLVHKYNLSAAELDGWALLHSKIEPDLLKLSSAKYLSSIFRRTVNLAPQTETTVVSLIKKFRTLAKKQGDMYFYESLTQDLTDYAV
mgnify:CR=1 FL=1